MSQRPSSSLDGDVDVGDIRDADDEVGAAEPIEQSAEVGEDPGGVDEMLDHVEQCDRGDGASGDEFDQPVVHGVGVGIRKVDQMDVEPGFPTPIDRSGSSSTPRYSRPSSVNGCAKVASPHPRSSTSPGPAGVVEHLGGDAVGRVPREVEAVATHVACRNRWTCVLAVDELGDAGGAGQCRSARHRRRPAPELLAAARWAVRCPRRAIQSSVSASRSGRPYRRVRKSRASVPDMHSKSEIVDAGTDGDALVVEHRGAGCVHDPPTGERSRHEMSTSSQYIGKKWASNRSTGSNASRRNMKQAPLPHDVSPVAGW